MPSSSMALLGELSRELLGVPCPKRGYLLFRFRADAVHRLSFHADSLGDSRKSNPLVQQFTHSKKLVTRECWLSSAIFRPVVVCQRVRDPGFLRFFRDFGLGLRGCSHKGNERISDRLLHGVGSRSVEYHPVDHCLNPDAATDELPHSVGHVLIVAPQAINPANHQCVALPKDIEKSASFRTFTEARGDARNAMVGKHQIRLKSVLVSLGSLVLDGLIERADPAIKNSFHPYVPSPEVLSALGIVHKGKSTLADGHWGLF
jgi:hypothetical protein